MRCELHENDDDVPDDDRDDVDDDDDDDDVDVPLLFKLHTEQLCAHYSSVLGVYLQLNVESLCACVSYDIFIIKRH